MGDFLQLRFVPTMRCNLKCSYCFLKHSRGDEPTMFDRIPPSEWIKAMKNFENYDVEFYMWGGEPFCLDGTYDLIKGFAEYGFVKWARIDSNMTFTKKIVERCPSDKVKILCSWHTEVFDFNQYWKLIKQLKVKKMVGMANFVASDQNMLFLKKNNLDVDYLIKKFADKDIFFNIAADFNKADAPEYKRFITQYMTTQDWDHIHGNFPSRNTPCDASKNFFTVNHDGSITSCGLQKKRLWLKDPAPVDVGNFFTGKLRRKNKTLCPEEKCASIVSYSHRLDNSFQSVRHLEDYIKRNTDHRKKTG